MIILYSFEIGIYPCLGVDEHVILEVAVRGERLTASFTFARSGVSFQVANQIFSLFERLLAGGTLQGFRVSVAFLSASLPTDRLVRVSRTVVKTVVKARIIGCFIS